MIRRLNAVYPIDWMTRPLTATLEVTGVDMTLAEVTALLPHGVAVVAAATEVVESGWAPPASAFARGREAGTRSSDWTLHVTASAPAAVAAVLEIGGAS